jgi:hypothetical protein
VLGHATRLKHLPRNPDAVPMRRILALVLIPALAAACTQARSAPSKTNEPNRQAVAYAQVVCGTTAAWKADIVQGLNRIRVEIKKSSRPSDAKAIAEHAAEGWQKATARVIADVQSHVPPQATKGADAYHDRLIGDLHAFADTVTAFRNRVRAFAPTGSLFPHVAAAIGTVRSGLKGLGMSFHAIAGTPMDRALEEDAACAYLTQL